MTSFLTKQWIFIVKQFYLHKGSLGKVRRAFNNEFGAREVPSKITICKLIKKFEEIRKVIDNKAVINY